MTAVWKKCSKYSQCLPSRITPTANYVQSPWKLGSMHVVGMISGFSLVLLYIADMPHDTDYPYPIRILAVF